MALKESLWETIQCVVAAVFEAHSFGQRYRERPDASTEKLCGGTRDSALSLRP